MDNTFRDKTVLLTGAAGTVGSELLRKLLLLSPGEIRLLDNNESGLFLLGEQYQTKQVIPFLGDVRDPQKLLDVTKGVDIAFHCAAFKHVYLSEFNPFEAVQTNIMGVKNLIDAALQNKIKRVIFTSSDKAVNPTSVMGTSKLMGERLITAANLVNSSQHQIFSSVRFGNVIGSRGSVFPIFRDQIRKGGPVTVTDPGMTRFVMTISQAAQMVLEGAMLAKGGEVIVTKMPVFRISDLAEIMIELLAPRYGYDPEKIRMEIIGPRPGEKLYEELITEEEAARSVELRDMFVVLPAFRAIYRKIDYSYPGAQSHPVVKPYRSNTETHLSKDDIRQFLIENELLSSHYGMEQSQAM